jgi:hypothetical protein
MGPSVGRTLEIERLGEEITIHTELRDLQRAMLGKTNPRDALMVALDRLIEKIGADGGHVRLLEEEWLEMIGGKGPYYETTKEADVRKYVHIESRGSVSTDVLRTGRPHKGYRGEESFRKHEIFRQSLPGAREKDALMGTESFAVYPLIFRNYKVGTLNLESSQPYFFERYEVERLIPRVQELAAPLLLHMLLEQRARRIASILETLAYIEQRVVGETDIDRALWLVLTGLTTGSGLAFNRAIYFETEGDGKLFTVRMAIGTQKPGDDWQYEDIGAQQKIEDKIGSLLEDFENNRKVKLNSPFAREIRSISLDIDRDEDSFLINAVEQKHPIRAADDSALHGNTILQKLRDTGVQIPGSFAWAPLVSEGEVIGAIYVDNVFTRKPIYDLDMNYLEIFCNDMAASLSLAKRADLWRSQYILTGHNLLGPLHTMLLGLSALYKEESLDARYRKRIGGTLRATQEASVQFRNILEMYRIRSGEDPGEETEVRNLGRLVRDALEFYPVVAERKHIKIAACVSDSVFVRGTEMELKHIVQVLVSNAISYSDDHKQVDIRVRRDGSKDVAFLEVKDEGWGIPEDERWRIYEENFRGRRAGSSNKRGLGIGLSVVRGIVRRYGGAIKCQSKEDTGTTFTIELPLAEGVQNV